MDCRETQALLTAFHDGELPDADRARVEKHLRDCLECGRMLTDLVRADEVAGVPDPGPGYWDRFNARVADRIEREAEGPKVSVLRPKQGWMRQQLRFLVPAVAAAALVVVVVRYGGQSPVAPKSVVPPAVAVKEQPALDSAGQRTAKSEHESPATKKAGDAAVARRVPAESNRAAGAPVAPPPAISTERLPAVAREERDRLADRHMSEENERASQDRAAAPAGSMLFKAADGMTPRPHAERKKMAGAAPPATEPKLAAKAESASGMRIGRDDSPCGMAETLSAQGRLREAEAAQRECLARDQSPPTREKGLIFLAELLDRQARFADADAVLTEVDRQFPKSLPLELYRQLRPMVQTQKTPALGIRNSTPASEEPLPSHRP